jgi:hypothetical protein
MFKATTYPSNDSNVCKIIMINEIVREEFGKMIINDPIN